jgi:hypothetical protein
MELSCVAYSTRSMGSSWKPSVYPTATVIRILREHRASHFIVEDTGLGIARTANIVLIEMTSRPRRRDEKEAIYRLLARRCTRSAA